VVYQTAVEEIDQERVAGITKVAVSMDCAGYIDNEVSIFNVYNLDMRTTDVVGRVGAAVDIETTQEFDEATIIFTYDEEALGDSLEDNLRIVWYDEENDQYVVMDEETVIDKENNTLLQSEKGICLVKLVLQMGMMVYMDCLSVIGQKFHLQVKLPI